MSRVRTRRTGYVSCSTVELRPGEAGTAGFEPATSRLTVEVSQSFTPLLVTVEARTNRYTFESAFEAHRGVEPQLGKPSIAEVTHNFTPLLASKANRLRTATSHLLPLRGGGQQRTTCPSGLRKCTGPARRSGCGQVGNHPGSMCRSAEWRQVLGRSHR
jgi:hypothetical protein